MPNHGADLQQTVVSIEWGFMQIIKRNDQKGLSSQEQANGNNVLTDNLFDGVGLPRELTSRNWLSESSVHRTRALASRVNTTRYFAGPQVAILRDDNRLVTWAAIVEHRDETSDIGQLLLCKLSSTRPASLEPPRLDRRVITEGAIWRYHLALDKYTGDVTATWVTRSGGHWELWFGGKLLKTEAAEPDFPFHGFSQPPIGHVATKPSPFSLISYKCRKTGRLFVRRVEKDEVGPETELQIGDLLGGLSFAILGDKVVARADVLKAGKIVPLLITSTDSGKTFDVPHLVDLSQYEAEFEVAPGYSAPVVDIGGNFHAPIIATNGKESAALNYVLAKDALVEAIRVAGGAPRGGEAVFPATVGNPGPYGNGVSDGFGLIMILSTEGRLFTSNSSAGGIFYPKCTQLNREMPLAAAFAATECYGSGAKPNFVSMDYIYIEADSRGEPVSSVAHLETWDMPLPVPRATAKSSGSRIEVTVLSDADFEPGKVNFRFDDPSVTVTDAKITGLRTAVLETDSKDLKGKTLIFDVDTIFHRHYGTALIS